MKKRGISLILLIITIIVIIIIAGAVILNLTESNPILKANESAFKSNIDQYNSELTLYLSREYLEKNGSFDSSTFNAGIWDGNDENIAGTIKDYITNITKSDGSKFKIVSGKLVYIYTDDNNELEWATSTGVVIDNGGTGERVESTSSIWEFDSSTGTITGYLGPDLPDVVEGEKRTVIIPNYIDGVAVKNLEDPEEYYIFGSSNLYYADNIVVSSGIEKIGEYAFCGFESTSVTLPSTLKEIGSDAFDSCYNLTTITLPSYLISIGDLAFSGCESLVNIEIPSSVSNMGYDPFSGCYGLQEINVDPGNQYYSSADGVLFNKDKTKIMFFPASSVITAYEIPDGVTELGMSVFSGCLSLTSITIPNSVKIIDSYAFTCCISLTSITIPSSVTTINEYPFMNCDGLASVNVEAGSGYYISDNGVLYDKNKTKLIIYPQCKTGSTFSIPSSVKSLEIDAFSDCRNLTSINIPDGLTTIKRGALGGCSALTSLTIPSTVTEIGDCAFCVCSKVQSIIIPTGVLTIGSSVFSGCTSLTSMIIPNTVTSIGWYAFGGCSKLASIAIPSSVTEIDSEAFSNCDALTSIIVDKATNSITGSPWGATNATVTWNG